MINERRKYRLCAEEIDQCQKADEADNHRAIRLSRGRNGVEVVLMR